MHRNKTGVQKEDISFIFNQTGRFPEVFTCNFLQLKLSLYITDWKRLTNDSALVLIRLCESYK